MGMAEPIKSALGRGTLLVCLGLGLLSAIQGAISLVSFYRTKSTINALNSDTYASLYWAGKLKGVAKDQRIAVVFYINAKSDKERDEYEALVVNTEKDLKEIRDNYPKVDPRDRNGIEIDAVAQSRFFQAWVEIRDSCRAGKTRQAWEIYNNELMQATLDRRKMEDYLASVDKERGDQRSQDALHAVSFGIPVVWTVLLLTVVLGTGTFLIFARRVNRSSIELQTATDRLTLATMASGVGIWSVDVPSGRIAWDEQMYRLYGIEADLFSVTDAAWKTLIFAEDRPLVDERIQELLELDRVIEFSHRITRPDGSVRYIRAFAQQQRDASGRLVRVIGTSWDITEQKQTERHLRESEQRLRRIFEDSGSVMLLIEMESGEIIEANQAAVNYYGYPQEQLVGMPVHNINMMAREEVTVQRKRALHEKQICFNFRHRLASGEVREVEVYSSTIEQNDKMMVFSIVHDVSERKRAEIELRDSEEKFRLLTENIREVFWIMNGEGTEMLFLSPPFEDLWGLPRESVYHNLTSLMDVIHADDRERARETFVRQLRGEYTDFEFRILIDGKVKWILDHAIPVRNDDGRVERVVGFAEDITERKGIAEKLAKSERRYRATFEQVAVGIFHTSHDGNLLRANARFAEIIGYSSAEIPGMTVRQITYPGDIAGSEEVFERLRTGETARWEKRYIRKDGIVTWVRLTSSAQRDEQGRILHFITVVEDINARKQAEDKLLESNERLALATRAGAVGIWDFDILNNLLVWDEQMFRLYGIGKDKSLSASQAWHAGMHPDDRQSGDDEIDAAIHGDKDFDTEFRVVWPDGSIHYIRALGRINRDDDGNAVHMIGTNWDITAEKQAANALLDSNRRLEDEIVRSEQLAEEAAKAKGKLEESAQYLQTLFDAVPVGIFVVDAETRLIQDVNPYLQQLIGLNKDQITGHQCNDTICPAAKNLCPILDLKQVVDQSEKTLLTADGRQIPVLKSVISLVKDGRQVLVESCVDISAQKQAAAALQELNRDLEEETMRAGKLAREAALANAAKSEFLANMSHEIRTPMNGVIGMTGLLLHTNLTAEQRRYARAIEQSGESLLGLINDILDLSKIEAGKLQLETVDFDLSELLDQLVSTLTVQARAKGLVLLSILAPGTPSNLRGDPGRLRQILVNFVGNAIKFTAAGEVVLSASLRDVSGDGVLLHFLVRDTGIGIPEDKIGILFDKFSQVDASTTRAVEGTGLGLAISKQLASAMGGEVGVTSVEGRGSEFWFTVRMDRGNQVSVQPIALRPEEFRLDARILLAEDNPVNQEVAIGILKMFGLSVHAVANGREALHALETCSYDLVLMDVRMPMMDGIEATRLIRDPKSAVLNHSIPVVAMTANAMRADRDHCLNAGMNDVVPKPVDPMVLQNALQRWLPASRDESASDKQLSDSELPDQDERHVFNRSALLKRVMGNESIVKRVLAAFLGDCPLQIELLKKHAESGDVVSAGRQAHSIKGAAANVGGERLCQAALKIETDADDGKMKAVQETIKELEARFLELKKTIEEEANAEKDRGSD
jgi:PAS domain S-box-containing protein